MATCREQIEELWESFRVDRQPNHEPVAVDIAVRALVLSLAERIDAIERRLPSSRCHHTDEFGQLCIHELGHRGPHHARAT